MLSTAQTCRFCLDLVYSSRSAGDDCHKRRKSCARNSSSFSGISLKLGEFFLESHKISPVNLIFHRNPTPDRPFEAWQPYNTNTKYIKILGTKIDSLLHNRILKDSSFEQNHDKIDDLLSVDTEERLQVVVSNLQTPPSYQHNPYHLSSINHGYDKSTRGVQYDASQGNAGTKNTDYYFYLRRIYSFWYEYLPSLYRNYVDRTGRASSEQDRFSEGK